LLYEQPDFRTLLDSQDDCRLLSHFYDELSHGVLKNALKPVPQQVDADGQSLFCHNEGALDNTREYNQVNHSDIQHPYVDRVLKPLVESSLKACKISPYGDAMVCDISVASSNHYITKLGVCNSNTWIGYDELPNWPDLEAYDAMKASLRPTTAAVCCRIRATGNPGGVGHTPVKQRFIDPSPPWTPFEDAKGERMFIPSSVWDNKILLDNDKTYIQRLEQSGPDHLVKAWLYGDWNLVLGSFFDCWNEEKNVKPLGRVPDHWFRFRSFDWGGHAPFCVLWWAVSDGVSSIMGHDGNYILPRGAKVCYREWYGCDEKDFKKGLSLDNEEIAAGILKRTEFGENIAFTVSDNLPFQRRGGPTIAETFANCGVPLIMGDTDRVSGCSAMYLAIKGGESRVPMMYFMENCHHCIRQIPLAQKDPKLIEVYLQGNDDHGLDCVKLSGKIREFVQNSPASLPDEAEKLHNSIIARPTWQQIMDTHFSKVRQARDPYGLR
jgi:hypothetical protein